ncbi:hypothetical protein J1614_000086 [Plenodomus biglobosus]|nr:hypothetical protein J1614_000086 [Plenodomus biglobosus]
MRILQGDPTELPAYPNYNMPDEVRARACKVFEAGTQATGILLFEEMPSFYGQSAEEIRDFLDENNPDAGDFVLIGTEIEQDEVVTYVGGWHDPSVDGLELVDAEKDRILLKLQMKLRSLPTCWNNYLIGNSSLAEDISMVLSGDPYDPDAMYPPLDFEEDEDPSVDDVVYVVAEPGEWEQGPGYLLDVDPPQDFVYRLTREVAEANDLESAWAVGWVSESSSDASVKTMSFTQKRRPRQPR